MTTSLLPDAVTFMHLLMRNSFSGQIMEDIRWPDSHYYLNFVLKVWPRP